MSNYRCISYTGPASTLNRPNIVPLVVIDKKRKIAYAPGNTIEWIFGGNISLAVQIIPNLYKWNKIKRSHSIRSRRLFTLSGSPLYKAIKNTAGVKSPPKVIYPINAVVDSLNILSSKDLVEERALLVGLDPYGNPRIRKRTKIQFDIIPVSILSPSSPPSLGWYSPNNENDFGLSPPSPPPSTERDNPSTSSTTIATNVSSETDTVLDYEDDEEEEEEDDNEYAVENDNDEYYLESSDEEVEEHNLLSDRELHETSCLSSSSPPSSPRIITRFSEEYTLGTYIIEFKQGCPMRNNRRFTDSKLWKYVDEVYMNNQFFKFGTQSRKDIIQEIVHDTNFRLTKIPPPSPEHKEETDDDEDDDDNDIFKDLIPVSPSSSPPPSLFDTSTTCSACCTFRKPSYYCYKTNAKNINPKKFYYGSSCGIKIVKIAWVVDQLDGLAKGTIKSKSVNSDLIKNEILFFASNKCID